LINNRQGGRRRGRGGGPRGPNLGGQPGNRQDNRQRGNAAQLLEKYKNMARDAQLAGDRVQTEYYLQYADHYFRVLGESRSRFEDQRPQRGNDLDEDEGDEEMAEAGEEQASGDDERSDRPERAERHSRRDRPRRFDRDERPAESRERDPAPSLMNGADDSIPLDVLPPAIGADAAASLTTDEPAAPRPRRRAKATRPAEDEDDVAPAA
jgi:hypothetical protein